MNAKQIMSIVLIVILIINMLLLAFGRITNLAFWIILILCAISGAMLKRIKPT